MQAKKACPPCALVHCGCRIGSRDELFGVYRDSGSKRRVIKSGKVFGCKTASAIGGDHRGEVAVNAPEQVIGRDVFVKGRKLREKLLPIAVADSTQRRMESERDLRDHGLGEFAKVDGAVYARS